MVSPCPLLGAFDSTCLVASELTPTYFCGKRDEQACFRVWGVVLKALEGLGGSE